MVRLLCLSSTGGGEGAIAFVGDDGGPVDEGSTGASTANARGPEALVASEVPMALFIAAPQCFVGGITTGPVQGESGGRAGRLWSERSDRAYGLAMRALIFLVAFLVVAGCASSGDADDGAAADASTTTASTTVPKTLPGETSSTVVATTTTAGTTTTTAPITTTTVTTTTVTTTTAPTTTTTSGGPYVIDDPEFYPLSPLPGSDGAGGSGCSPGSGPLPDGVWFGYVVAKSPTEIDFDLACFYFGDIAYTKGAEDGAEVNNDYYVRNVNPTLRTIPVAPSAGVWEIEAGSIGYLDVPFSDWPIDASGYIACPSDWCGVWLFVNSGNVTEILEQYVP